MSCFFIYDFLTYITSIGTVSVLKKNFVSLNPYIYIYMPGSIGCFLCQWLLLGAILPAPKKWKNTFFQDKFYSLKAHAHYLTVIHIYIYIYISSWFLWVLDHSDGHTSLDYRCPPKISVLPVCNLTASELTASELFLKTTGIANLP